MRSCTFLLSAGLASALNLGGSSFIQGGKSNLDANVFNNSFNVDVNSPDFDPGSLAQGGLDLSSLNVDGLDVGSLDFSDQDAVAQAIGALLGNLCLNNALDLNSISGLGLNNEVELFLQLAQLQKLQQLGFLSLGNIGGLFDSGLVPGGFNVGE